MAVQDFFGIDPGLHTSGIVHLAVDVGNHELEANHHTFVGNVDHVQGMRWFISENLHDAARRKRPRIFVEKFRERGNSYAQDDKMRQLMHSISDDLGYPYTLIDNTGVKKVVRRTVRELLGMTNFPVSHHQDLEAAANIMIYGMLKDPELNKILADIVKDHIDGYEWRLIT